MKLDDTYRCHECGKTITDDDDLHTDPRTDQDVCEECCPECNPHPNSCVKCGKPTIYKAGSLCKRCLPI